MSDILTDHEKDTIRDFHHWIVVARRMVHDSFTGDEKELQRLTMQAAEGLMMDHRLGAIESQLADIKTALSDKE
ncbi:hypothetical protein BC777_1625 [Yoonia maricola]|uniref:Uncharacterized protein n=1 Tax=Yoonia maricola TaxID=420999 RepID=A0A2M8WPD5_9RHOB|nr:hypothetical protein [Yoonia maricola]PJI92764.1 hypothetical protein BC777_1625 [Yoonia maricola]